MPGVKRRLLTAAVVVAVVPVTATAALADHGKHTGWSKHDHRPAPQPTSGVVTLRTTNDSGLCASAPAATTSSNGAACPTFPLYWARPSRSAPRALVVVFHGHGHNGEQYVSQLQTMADQLDLAAVAASTDELSPDKSSYRGPFDSVDEEAREAASAISWARQRFHTRQTYLFGVSMGGSGLAYFIDAATRAPQDTDAAWVQQFRPLPVAGLVDVEGIASLPETWAEATGFDKTSAAEIEKETGGTPAAAPTAYQSRSLALLPTAEWKATGLRAAAVIHDVDDGLVPYNQTFEARAAIAAAGIPVQTYDVVFKDSCTQGNQTTLSATVVKAVSPDAAGSTESALCLAGHASENDPTTPNMEAAVQALKALVNGSTVANETIVNTQHPNQ